MICVYLCVTAAGPEVGGTVPADRTNMHRHDTRPTLAMGLGLRFDSIVDARELKRQQAELKAKKLVALVQGTSGLKGQAVDKTAVESMVEQTTHELLAGSKRRLWSVE